LQEVETIVEMEVKDILSIQFLFENKRIIGQHASGHGISKTHVALNKI